MFTNPEDAVDYRKRKNLSAAMNHYVKYKRIDFNLRFDIITVVGTKGEKPEITHMEDVRLF